MILNSRILYKDYLYLYLVPGALQPTYITYLYSRHRLNKNMGIHRRHWLQYLFKAIKDLFWIKVWIYLERENICTNSAIYTGFSKRFSKNISRTWISFKRYKVLITALHADHIPYFDNNNFIKLCDNTRICFRIAMKDFQNPHLILIW